MHRFHMRIDSDFTFHRHVNIKHCNICSMFMPAEAMQHTDDATNFKK